ncbi:hypothetical protein JTE90_003326 [Oedothorax gibbosus]|uniref:Hexosyltransferase n=1 Tax=Oedothorax gibbosus TaxID=931172 RepID=A0AAV6UGJ5_9ARAC|nr:hypothetical protein JTE90_003326 [Oedothorax gibbosus]
MKEFFPNILCCKYLLNSIKRLGLVIFCLCFMFIYGTYFFRTSTSRQPKSDLDNYTFDYLIENDICENVPYLLILVHSASNHFEHRNVIRETMGNPGGKLPSIKVAFLLAITEDLQDKIWEENQKHADIIQGNFVDSYRNLTYKHAMGLSWASSNCNRTKYIMKMDDDIFVDIYQLVDYIKNKLGDLHLQKNIACYYQRSMPVVRDTVSKWYVSKTEYQSDTFDDYCSGWAYITTPKVAGLLYEAVKKLPFFWVDDVHLTGSAAQVAGVGRIRLNQLYALETDGLLDWTRSKAELRWDKVFAPTWGDLDLSRRAHKKARMCHNRLCKCCYRKPTTPRPTTSSTTVKGSAQLIVFPIH